MRKIARRLFSSKQKERIQKKDSFPKYSILLAEDNLLVAHAIKNLLEQRGYRVTAG